MAEEKKTVLIQISENNGRTEVHSTGNAEETKALLTGAICLLYGIPEVHRRDAAAFLTVLGESYRKDKQGDPGSMPDFH